MFPEPTWPVWKKDDREKKPAWKDHRSVNIKFSQAVTEKALEISSTADLVLLSSFLKDALLLIYLTNT